MFRFLLVIVLLTIFHCNAQPFSNVVSLDGQNDFIEIPNAFNTQFQSNVTIEAWVKPCAIDGHRMILTKFWCGNNGNQFYFTILDGKLRWAWDNTGCNDGANFYETGIVVQANVWQHVAIKHTPTGVTIYYNGSPIPGTLIQGSYANMLLSNEPLRIGVYKTITGNWFGSYFGLMDEVRIWDAALSDALILSRYNAPLVGNEPNLEGYYNMDISGVGNGITVPNIATNNGNTVDGVTIGTASGPFFFNQTTGTFNQFLGNDTTLCQGDSILLDASLIVGTYLWQDGSSDSVQWVNQPGNYYVTVTKNCEVYTDTIQVDYFPLVTVDFGVDTTLCGNETLNLDATFINANYAWQDGSNAPTFNVNSAGWHWVVVEANGCFGGDSILISYLPAADVNLGPDTSACLGTNILLNANTGATSYLWNNGSTNTTLNVNQSGVYFVETAGYCGSSYDTIQVNFIAAPIVNLGNDTLLCANETYLINAPNINGATGYLWQDGSTGASFLANQTGNYSLAVSIDGCTGVGSIQVNYSSLFLDLGPTDTTLCFPATLNLDLTQGNASYLWQDGTTNSTYTISENGMYYVTISDNTCSLSDTIQVELNKVNSSFSFSTQSECGLGRVICQNLSAVNMGTINQLEWYIDGERITSVNSPLFNFEVSGNYAIQLKAYSTFGCFADTTITIPVVAYPVPLANFQTSTNEAAENDPVQFINLSYNADTYQWLFSDGFVSVEKSLSHTFETPGFFQIDLYVSNEWCHDTVVKFVTVKTPIRYYIPNAFTPDGNALNQLFSPIFQSGFDPYDFQLTIYNQWGEVLFITHNATIGWDGTYNNSLVKNGVYLWKVKFLDTEHNERIIEYGTVTVVR
ncbi:hypothetical protein DNU06_03040 [Putridiphycobacter roseus]|uniref:PKD domain-containing protein n=1 Tax=Putridiphycobacter roseus TaxID=2219161 RepID=A0A2W1NT46_9FLAO|nr:LamG-like jellyroll fold domain-containing protein [Putridiphycobacter roseus]PZE18822.1 hypothetical protein DNU06_03040 [Putridiphycobacter roseus]